MPLKLRTFRIGDAPKRGDGLRLAAARFLPRGVKKADYGPLFDLWFPVLAPSQRLLKGRAKKNFKSFMQRYEAELRKTTDARQSVLLVAALAKHTPISIGCYCAGESTCHRAVLARVIRDAGEGRWPGASG
jgi:uncharacterized protein YeaO (DUF488 family)